MADARLNQVVWVGKNLHEVPGGNYLLFLGNSIPLLPSGIPCDQVETETEVSRFFRVNEHGRRLVAVLPRDLSWAYINKDLLLELNLKEFLEFGQERAAAVQQIVTDARKAAMDKYPKAKEAEGSGEDPEYIMLSPAQLEEVQRMGGMTGKAKPTSDGAGHYL